MSLAIRSYLGKRDYAAYKRGMARTHGVSSFASSSRRRVYAPRPSAGLQVRNAPYPGQMRRLGKEKKSIDLPFNVYAIDTTGVFTPINLIRTGSTFNNRIGRKIELKSVRVDGMLDVIRASTEKDYIRIMIVYDRQPTGALPAISDLLQDTDQATQNSTNSLSHPNVNNVDRFSILRDYRIIPPMISSFTSAAVYTVQNDIDPISPTYKIDCYVKLKGLLTQYKADSAPAVIGDIATGTLYLVTVGALSSGQEAYQLQANIRLRFEDA